MVNEAYVASEEEALRQRYADHRLLHGHTNIEKEEPSECKRAWGICQEVRARNLITNACREDYRRHVLKKGYRQYLTNYAGKTINVNGTPRQRVTADEYKACVEWQEQTPQPQSARQGNDAEEARHSKLHSCSRLPSHGNIRKKSSCLMWAYTYSCKQMQGNSLLLLPSLRSGAFLLDGGARGSGTQVQGSARCRARRYPQETTKKMKMV